MPSSGTQAECPPLRPGYTGRAKALRGAVRLIAALGGPLVCVANGFPNWGAPGLPESERVGYPVAVRPAPRPNMSSVRFVGHVVCGGIQCAMPARRRCAPMVGRHRHDANDAPSSALIIVLGDHRHACPVAVTPRASSAQLAGTPLRGLPPATFAGTRRAGARPRVPLLPPNPRRRVVHRARRPTIVRRPPPSPLAGPLRPAPPRSRRRRRPAKILGASTAPAAAVVGGVFVRGAGRAACGLSHLAFRHGWSQLLIRGLSSWSLAHSSSDVLDSSQ